SNGSFGGCRRSTAGPMRRRPADPSCVIGVRRKEASSMSWTYLFIAGAFEIVWAIGLKYTEGFTRPWPCIGTVSAMIASFVFLSEALKTIPVGTGYAVWTGIGAAGTAALGMVLLGESRDPARIACIGAIVAGIVGLKLSTQ